MHSPFSGDDGIAKRTGYRSNESSRVFGSCFAINCIYWIAGTGFSPFGVYSVGIAAITAAICQSPEAHPDKDQRWLAAAVAGIFI
ncbi:benzoate/H(+) symporter BenE family transporter [Escherichia coli]|nr:benzoate/H(+) symporter BenE family transporter [Escherichia coli]